jgi:heme/copper-type cytochrome/quinol oxidase subunit 3
MCVFLFKMKCIQFCILITYYGALTINTSSMINFGVEGEGLGVFLVLLNLIILFLAGWLAYVSFHEQKHRNTLKEKKV